jgi:hypothetical protein
MALHRACPVHASDTACLDARTRSVSPRSCPGAPPFCPMQELSRTPQTRPTNDRPPTKQAGQRPVHTQRGAKNARTWWRGFRTSTHLRATDPMNPLVRELALCSRPGGCTTQCRLSRAQSVPRNSRTAAHIPEPKHGTRVVRRLIRFSLRARGRCAETMSYLTRSAAWVTGSARRTCSGPAPRSARRRRRRPRGPTWGEPSVPNHSDLPRRSGRS